MRRLRPYLALGLAVFVLAAVASLPAALLSRGLPSRVTLEGVSGTLWDGAATTLRLDGAALGALDWTLSPWALLRGTLAGQVVLTRPDGHLNGHLVLHADGALEASSLTLDLPLTTLHPEHDAKTWDGRIRGQVAYARLDLGWPVALQGHFDLLHLHAPQSPDDLGSFVLDFDPRDAKPTALLGRLHDTGGPLSVTGQLRLEQSRAYQLDGDVAAHGVISEDLTRTLAFFGSPQPNGSRPFTITGTF